MKLETNSAAVEVVGGGSNSSFSIAMNGKAFRVLSDTLYQNKLGSIVRELSCNAYDAHIAAGNKDTPIEIHLPDAFEPWLAIRDFGIGMDRDTIKNVFTVYFQSTKDQSNDSLGAFGLGAKTPFSYTDQFTVTSIKDGEKCVYGMYITESGVPDYNLMHSEETTEGNGTEINISIKREDYQRVAQEVSNQLKYFTVKPVFKNGQVSFAETKYFMENEDFRIEETVSWGKEITIIQGQVGYPLNHTLIPETESSRICKALANHGLQLIFKIGEIGVTASREGVEYDDRTIKNILAKMDKVKEEFEKFAKKELESIKTEWDRAVAVRNNVLLQKVATKSIFPTATRVNSDWTFSLGNVTGITTVYAAPILRRKPRHIRPQNLTIYPHAYSAIIVKDTANRSNMRLEHYRSTVRNSANILVVEIAAGTDVKTLVADMKKNLGGFDNIVLLSSVELPSNASSIRAPRAAVPKYYELEIDGQSLTWHKAFDAVDEISASVVYYVEFEYGKPGINYEEKLETVRHLSAEEDVPMIIGLREAVIEKIKSNPKFKPLEEYIATMRTKYMQDNDFLKKARHYYVGYDVVYGSVQMVGSNFHRVIKNLAAETDMGKFGKVLEKYVSAKEKNQWHYTTYRRLGGEITGLFKKQCCVLAKIDKTIWGKYPLVAKLKHQLYDSDVQKALARYVQLEYNAQSSTE